MIFRNQQLIEEVLGIIASIPQMNHKQMMYASILGSISKGIQRYDSDYDTKFFYMDKGKKQFYKDNAFFESKWVDTTYRYFPTDTFNNTLFYDKIAIWDIYSFMEILVNPRSKEREISPELYYQVLHTLMSPYQWDPYGICLKVMPLVWKVYSREYLVEFYEKEIKKRYRITESGEMAERDYLKTLYALFSIMWILENDSIPPIYLKSLLSVEKDTRITGLVMETYSNLIRHTYQLIEERGGYKRKISKYIYIPCIKELDEYITMKLQNISEIKDRLKKDASVDEQVYMFNNIVNIIDGSLKEEKVKYIYD